MAVLLPWPNLIHYLQSPNQIPFFIILSRQGQLKSPIAQVRAHLSRKMLHANVLEKS